MDASVNYSSFSKHFLMDLVLTISRWTGDYETGHICACVHACVCVRLLVCHAVFSKSILVTDFYLPPGGSPEWEIMKCSLCVHACVCGCVRPLVCHADCRKTIGVTDFFSKKSPNKFSCPRIFFWFYSFSAKIE